MFHYTEFLEFQRLLLNKEIRYCTDISVIKTLASDPVCRVDTIRLIFEPFSRSKYIIYFQHLGLAPDQKAGFIEWPGMKCPISTPICEEG
jgi:hypothetical protein